MTRKGYISHLIIFTTDHDRQGHGWPGSTNYVCSHDQMHAIVSAEPRTATKVENPVFKIS